MNKPECWAPATVSFDQAERFLTLLDEGQETFTFQTFDDLKNRGAKDLIRVLHGPLTEHIRELTELNKNGAGVFITVNETDLKGRKLENMVRGRAVFQEADRPATPEPSLTPHIQVESSPGKFHRYLLIDDQTAPAWDEWDGVMRRMVAEHGSDPAAKDRARVLRLPGFFHMKNPAEPHLVRIVAESGELPYSWAQIIEKIPPMEEPNYSALEMARGRGLSEPLKLKSALRTIPSSCEYGEWLQVLMALHHASGGSGEGLAMADAWSAIGTNYRPQEVAYKWASFGKYTAKPVTLATIYQAAQSRGWNWAHSQMEVMSEARDIAEKCESACNNDPPLAVIGIEN